MLPMTLWLDAWLTRTAVAGGAVLLVGVIWLVLTRQPARRQRIGELALLCSLLVALPAALPAWWTLSLHGWFGAAEMRETATESGQGPTAPEIVTPVEAEPLCLLTGREADEIEVKLVAMSDPELALSWHAAAAPATPPRAGPLPASLTAGFPWMTAVALVYVVLTATLLARLAVGTVGLWRMAARSRPAPGPIVAMLHTLVPSGGRVPRLGVCPGLHGPISFGLVRPTILLPPAFVAATNADGLRAVLVHELTHLARKDAWSCLLLAVSQAFYFHVPWFWWLRRQIRLAQEYIADAAAACVSSAIDYAQFLVQASARAAQPGLAGRQAMGVFQSSSDLSRRVHMLLKNPIPVERDCPSHWTALGAAGLVTFSMFVAGVRLHAEPPTTSPPTTKTATFAAQVADDFGLLANASVESMLLTLVADDDADTTTTEAVAHLIYLDEQGQAAKKDDAVEVRVIVVDKNGRVLSQGKAGEPIQVASKVIILDKDGQVTLPDGKGDKVRVQAQVDTPSEAKAAARKGTATILYQPKLARLRGTDETAHAALKQAIDTLAKSNADGKHDAAIKALKESQAKLGDMKLTLAATVSPSDLHLQGPVQVAGKVVTKDGQPGSDPKGGEREKQVAQELAKIQKTAAEQQAQLARLIAELKQVQRTADAAGRGEEASKIKEMIAEFAQQREQAVRRTKEQVESLKKEAAAQREAAAAVQRRIAERWPSEAKAGQEGGKFLITRPVTLMETGQAKLGVIVDAVPPAVREQVELPEGAGVVVVQVVPHSPAAKAGVKTHDIIVKLADEQVKADPEAFRQRISAWKVEKPFDMVVIRKGKPLVLKALTLQADPAREGQREGQFIAKPKLSGNFTFTWPKEAQEAPRKAMQQALKALEKAAKEAKGESRKQIEEATRQLKEAIEKLPTMNFAPAVPGDQWEAIEKRLRELYDQAPKAGDQGMRLEELRQRTQEMLEPLRETRQKALESLKQHKGDAEAKVPSGGAAPVRFGIRVEEVPAEVMKKNKLADDQGVYVVEVMPGTPAAKAGVKEHDIILKFAGKAVPADPEALRSIVQKTKLGETITIEVLRDGTPKKLERVTLSEVKVIPPSTPAPPKPPKAPIAPVAPKAPKAEFADAKGPTSVSVSRNADSFTASMQEGDGVKITVAGTMEAGKPKVEKVTVQTDDETKTYRRFGEIRNEKHRRWAEQLLKMVEGHTIELRDERD